MTLLDKIKKGLIDGFNVASDITSEYTKIGRIKIDMLGVKKEIEEKMLELGGRIYDNVAKSNNYIIKDDMQIQEILDQIKKFEEELVEYEKELKRIRNLDETSYKEKKG